MRVGFLAPLTCAVFFSQLAQAADYEWSDGQSWGYSSPAAACDGYVNRVIATVKNNTGKTYSKALAVSENIVPGVTQDCRYSILTDTGSYYRNNSVIALAGRGNSCRAGAELDQVSGECVGPEPDQCASTNGEITFHEHKQADITKDGGIANLKYPPESVCVNSCEYSAPAVDDCYRFANGDPAGVFCRYSYRGIGVSCTAGPEKPSNTEPSSRTPIAEKTNECTNKVEDAEGRQSFSCTLADKYTDPGKMDCGEVDGEFKCIAKSPPPKHTEKIVVEDVSEKTNSDGSKESTTTTTTTTTTCTGANSCQSSTTTNVNNSKTNADGTSGGSSDSCTGPGCKDADGKDQEDREEAPERSASVGPCDGAFSCSGDAIDCEVLRQQKEQLCLTEEMADFPKHQSAIEAAVTGDQFQLDEGSGVIDVPSFINQGTRFLPSACPTAERFSLITAGGRSFELSYEPLCRAASDLSGLFVAVATVLAALYVGRSVGGQ